MRQTTSTTSTMTRTPTRASCTTCEHALRARSLRLSFDVCVTCTSWLKVFLSLISSTFIVIHERFSLSSFSTLYFDLSFTILFHFFLLMHLEQHIELDNLITMQNLRTSANKGSNDAYDVHTSLKGYEPNDIVFSELGDSQGSFSYITQSSDLDIDDATLGKLLDEAHREHADYCDPDGVSVSQSSLSVVFDRTGKPVGERNVDQSIGCHEKHVQCSQQVF